MQNRIFLHVLFFMLLTAGAFAQSSYLQLSLFDDEMFSVVLDNTELSDGNVAEFDNLTAGEHYLKVTKGSDGGVIFEGKVKIPSGSDVYAVIDEYNSFSIYKKKKYNYNRPFCEGPFIKRCGDKKEYKDKKDYAIDECKYKSMKKEDYSDLRSSINNRNFESKNITVLKTALEKNYISSEQLKELLGYFTFETNKVDIAKYAYARVCDQKNFFKIYDSFSFDSSVEEIKNYISGK